MKKKLSEIENLISEKKFEEAKTELSKILLKDFENFEAQKLMGLVNVNLELYAEAKVNFEYVTKRDDKDATGWFYLASCYDNLEDFSPAEYAYKKVIELRPEYFDAYKCLCLIYMKTGYTEKAISLAQKAMELGTTDYILPYIIGTSMLKQQQFKECIPYFEEAIKLNPNHTQILNNLGTAYLALRDDENAAACYKKALELEPDNAETYFNLASLHLLKNQGEKALELFEKALEIAPDETHMNTVANMKFQLKKYDEAIDMYKSLNQQHPEKTTYKYKLMECYEAKGEYETAISLAQQLIMLNPGSVSLAHKLATMYIATKQLSKAKAIFDSIILKSEVSADIYYQYAILSSELCDTDLAEKMFKKVIKMEPNNAEAHKDLGIIYLNKRLFDYAEDEFKKAFEIAPNNKNIIKEYANFLYSLCRYKEADFYYKKASEKESDVFTKTFWSMNKIALNEPEEAKKLIMSALEDEHEHEFIQFLAGKVFYMLKDYENAKFYLIRSYEQNPDIETKNLLGLTYYELGEYEKANNIFKNLLEKNNKNTVLLLNSAKCYEKMNDTDNAIAQLDKLVEIFPENEEAQEMLRRIS